MLAAFLLTMTTTSASAQSFSFTGDGAVQPASHGEHQILWGLLTNISSTDSIFTLELEDSEIGDWIYLWCIGELCLSPGIYEWPDTIEQGMMDTIFVHMEPDSTTQSQGSITITAYPQSNPAAAQSVTYIAYFGVGVKDEPVDYNPESFTLSPAFPNPFNPAVSFTYTINQAENIRIAVFNLSGQEIVTLFDEFQTPGTHHLGWNGKDRAGLDLPAAMYLINFKSNHHQGGIKALKLK